MSSMREDGGHHAGTISHHFVCETLMANRMITASISLRCDYLLSHPSLGTYYVLGGHFVYGRVNITGEYLLFCHRFVARHSSAAAQNRKNASLGRRRILILTQISLGEGKKHIKTAVNNIVCLNSWRSAGPSRPLCPEYCLHDLILQKINIYIETYICDKLCTFACKYRFDM